MKKKVHLRLELIDSQSESVNTQSNAQPHSTKHSTKPSRTNAFRDSKSDFARTSVKNTSACSNSTQIQPALSRMGVGKQKNRIFNQSTKSTLKTNPSMQSLHSCSNNQLAVSTPKQASRLGTMGALQQQLRSHSNLIDHNPLELEKILSQASRRAQGNQKLSLHKELLDRQVSKLIDVIQKQDAMIKHLKKNQMPTMIQGKSSLKRLGKAQSQADLLLPFRSQMKNRLACQPVVIEESKEDFKKYFLEQKPQFDIQRFSESTVKGELSQTQSIVVKIVDKIDDANKSMLKDNEEQCLSQEGIECDLIRLNRIEQDRKLKQQRNERLFTESLDRQPMPPQYFDQQSSCNVMTEDSLVQPSQANEPLNRQTRNGPHPLTLHKRQTVSSSQMSLLSQSKMTDDYVRQLMQHNQGAQRQRNNSVKSNDTHRQSFTEDLAQQDEDSCDSLVILSSNFKKPGKIPAGKQIRYLTSLNQKKNQQRSVTNEGATCEHSGSKKDTLCCC